MTRPRILSVGQCGFDHGRIARFFAQAFGAEVRDVGASDEALAVIDTGAEGFDLILVNRINDADGSSGLDTIRQIRERGSRVGVPVPLMLVSDYPDAQARARDLGALPGFGKATLGTPETRARLAAVLTPTLDTPSSSS